MTFIDDRSRKSWVFLLTTKSETFNCFKIWKAKVENQKKTKIKILRSDNGGEYLSEEFQEFLRQYGITHQRTVAGTPQQNGVAERYYRTLIKMARSMM